jgi:hypothetical protein
MCYIGTRLPLQHHQERHQKLLASYRHDLDIVAYKLVWYGYHCRIIRSLLGTLGSTCSTLGSYVIISYVRKLCHVTPTGVL